MWNIKCYVSASGKNEVQTTYDSGSDALKAELEVEVAYLKVRGREEWQRPHAAKLSKCTEFRDFFEIRLFADNVQQRPIGYFGPNPNDFTILLWAHEKGGKLKPDNWCKKANRLRKEIIAGTATVADLMFEGDEEC